jgi:hypothetical protein
MPSREAFDVWLYKRSYILVLTDTCVDQIIADAGGSHQDGSRHEYEMTMTASGYVDKCTLCGKEQGIAPGSRATARFN